MTKVFFDGKDPAAILAAVGAEFKLRAVTGRDILPREIKRREISGADGDLFLSSSNPARVIGIEYDIRAKGHDKLLEASALLAGVFSAREPKALTFSDQPGTFYGLQESADTSDETAVKKSGSLSIYCADPYRYGQDQLYRNTSVSDAAPWTINVDTNDRVPAVLTVALSASTTKLIVDVNGRQLTYSATGGFNGSLTIDSVKKEVRVGGVLKVLEVGGWFPFFVGGDNVIKTNVSSSIVASYTERNR